MYLIKKLIHSPNQPHSRGTHRIQRAKITGLATLITRGVTVIASLVSIPLTAKYLGPERFGLWLTLNVILTWAGMADFGLANGLTNALATADGKENQEQAQQAVSSASGLMLMSATGLTILFLLVYPHVGWDQVFNVVSTTAISEAGPSLFVSVIFVLLRLPLSIPGRIYTAYQEGYIYQLWTGFSSILAVVGLAIAIHLQVSLPILISVFFGVTLLGDIFAAVHLFGLQKPSLRPNLKYFQWSQSQWLLSIGFQFWISQIAAVLIFQTDLIIISKLFGSEAVASYGVVLRLFTLITIVQAAFLSPLWPAYTEALSRRDLSWIFRTFKRTIYLSSIWALVIGLVLILTSSNILRTWVGETAIPSFALLLSMMFTTLTLTISQCIAVLINGLEILKVQTLVAPIAATSNLCLSILLGLWIGPAGVALSTGLCTLVFSIGIIGGNMLKELISLKEMQAFQASI
jgi:O-antigen/teichoic acid export membrane protein